MAEPTTHYCKQDAMLMSSSLASRCLSFIENNKNNENKSDKENIEPPIDPNRFDLLPITTDIKEWQKLKSFMQSFNRYDRLDLTESSLEEIRTILYDITIPTIVCMKVKHFNVAPRPQILFGLRDYDKLLAVEHNGNKYYFHGLWYMMMSELSTIPTILNDDEDIVYVGFGYEEVHSMPYINQWGHKYHPAACNKFDQGYMKYSEGTFFYTCNITYCKQSLGKKPST